MPLLGSHAVQQIGLLTVQHENILTVRETENQKINQPLTLNTSMQEYKDVFEGTGKLEGKYHLNVDRSVPPVVHPPRKVPAATKKCLKEELDKLSKEGLIAPVRKPTSWVSSLVIITKGDKMPFCLDPKDLNKALRRSHCPMTTLDQILPDLSHAKLFTVLDAKNGFWHIQLDDESCDLTSFNTLFGRYKWLQMPFGISTAP